MLTVASERLRGWICGGVWFVFDFSFDLFIYSFFFCPKEVCGEDGVLADFKYL